MVANKNNPKPCRSPCFVGSVPLRTSTQNSCVRKLSLRRSVDDSVTAQLHEGPIDGVANPFVVVVIIDIKTVCVGPYRVDGIPRGVDAVDRLVLDQFFRVRGLLHELGGDGVFRDKFFGSQLGVKFSPVSFGIITGLGGVGIYYTMQRVLI